MTEFKLRKLRDSTFSLEQERHLEFQCPQCLNWNIFHFNTSISNICPNANINVGITEIPIFSFHLSILLMTIHGLYDKVLCCPSHQNVWNIISSTTYPRFPLLRVLDGETLLLRAYHEIIVLTVVQYLYVSDVGKEILIHILYSVLSINQFVGDTPYHYCPVEYFDPPLIIFN